MAKLFLVIKGEVKYPTWCPHGLYLKELIGDREGDLEYPVDEYLGKSLINMIGKIVKLDLDFEIFNRDIHKSLLCDKGEIAGGTSRKDGWYFSMIGDDNKEYHEKSITPIQLAEKVSSVKNLEEIKWRKIEMDFCEIMNEPAIHDSPYGITNWFRNRLKRDEEK